MSYSERMRFQKQPESFLMNQYKKYTHELGYIGCILSHWKMNSTLEKLHCWCKLSLNEDSSHISLLEKAVLFSVGSSWALPCWHDLSYNCRT